MGHVFIECEMHIFLAQLQQIPMTRFSVGNLSLYSFLFSILSTSLAIDTISPSHPLRDAETLVSASQTFELGFFSLSDPEIQYLGIWYKKISPRTIVWVANRETPLSNTLGALNITSQSNLVLVNGTNHIFWSSNISRTTKDPVAQLLDSGNLVVRDANESNPDNFLWQSFDYPTDTLLPEMNVGTNLVTGHESFLSAWTSIDDPAPGQFSAHVDLHGYPQILIKKGNEILSREGSWNGVRFVGIPAMWPSQIFTFDFVMNKTVVYYKYEVHSSSIAVRDIVNPSGLLQRLLWNNQTNNWLVMFTSQGDQCGSYNSCGANAICQANNNPICSCLDGFVPKSPGDWNNLIWLGGCVRRTPLDCGNKDGFLKQAGVKLPDTSTSWFNTSMSLEECKSWCQSNCSCSGYATLDIREGGSGCLLWFDGLLDIKALAAGGQDLYVRMAASELSRIEKKKILNKMKAGIIAAAVMVMVLILMVFCIWRRYKSKYGMKIDGEEREDMDLLIFDLNTIEKATQNFSSDNKLGEGGFGPVYKGILIDGQEIAVKRLSTSSVQGLTEFKNEVILISKLQHRNLVKLLGCCIEKDEKLLIYEFMPNKSLDFFIFDHTRKILDWQKRLHIVSGIARGLLYLHQDSRLRIIHRDLKANNILLDNDMNPKISDFGIARIFGGDQTEANTNKVAGTYGYMAPEYAVDGLFSMKSDIFSFGVLVLEIVSGKKNRGFSHPDHNHNLLGHAWKLWIEERSLELVDNLLDSFVASEVLRCIQLGLLCVQQRPEDRPKMSSVVVMLGSESSLPQPNQPGFFTERNMPEADSSSSVNEMITTIIEAR